MSTTPDISPNNRHATLMGDAAILSPGLVPGDPASLSGGWLETGWETRCNIILNPNVEGTLSPGIGSNGGSQIAQSEDTFEGWPANGTKSVKVTLDGSATNLGVVFHTQAGTVQQGDTVHGQIRAIWPSGFAGNRLRVLVNQHRANGSYINNLAFVDYVATGEIQTLEVSGLLDHAEASLVTLIVVGQAHPGGAATTGVFYADCAITLNGSSVDSYFPTVEQLTANEAAWTGTADNSASLLGPCTPAPRTFLGVARRDSTDTMTLIGNSLALEDGGFALRVSGDDVTLDLGGAQDVWEDAAPATGTKFSWALTTEGTTAELFINGASEGTATITSWPTEHSTLQVGTFDSGEDVWDGRLGHVGVFYSVLGDEEIELISDEARLAA